MIQMQACFYGRTEELRELQKIFRDGSGLSSCSLLGPPGIGKRSLIRKAKDLFCENPHPGVYILEREFQQTDTAAQFFADILKQLQKKLTETALKELGISEQDIAELRTTIISAQKSPENDADLMDSFYKTMECCENLSLRIILVLYSFDSLAKIHEADLRLIISFLYSISQSGTNVWSLSTLLVSEIRPQFIANSVLSGSKFEYGYPPIPLHCFSDDDMAAYFRDFPNGEPEEAVRKAVLRNFGRYPSLLLDFRNSLSKEDVLTAPQVSAYAERHLNSALFHRLQTLMKRQYMDYDNKVTALEVVEQYFIGQDSSRARNMEDVYLLGLVDKQTTGEFTLLTELLTKAELNDSQFLKTLPGKQIPVDPVTDEISWLQLSDLHVSEEWDTEEILKSYQKLSKIIHPSFLVVTGDFRDKANGTYFDLAMSFLEKILSYFQLSKNDVFLIPGNHDCEDANEGVKERIAYITGKIASSYNCYRAHMAELYRRFSAYDSFCKSFYKDFHSDARFDDPSGTHLICWRDKLNILCANTALISDGDRTHQELVDLEGIQKALKTRRTDLPIILLGHHDLSALYDCIRTRIKKTMGDQNISVYLHGDTHKSSRELGSRIDLSHTIPSIGCGKSAPKSGDTYSDVGAVYYEWKKDGKVYVRWYKWYTDADKVPFKLDEDRSYGPGPGEYESFSILSPDMS